MEVLSIPLAERIRERQASSPLEPIQIMIPNSAIQRFAQFRLAQYLGIAANIEFSPLKRFLAGQLRKADPELSLLNKNALQLLIFNRIQNTHFLERNDLDGIQSYLAPAANEIEREVRAFQLAGELARLFEEYTYSRREMLARWPYARTLRGTQWSESERWQRRLYCALFDREGATKLQTPLGLAAQTDQMSLFGHRAEGQHALMLMDAIDRTLSDWTLPAEVHIFGLSYVAPAFARVFAHMATKTELYVYALNPCVEFWEDVRTAGLPTLRQDWSRRDEAKSGEMIGEDPFALHAYGDTPALRLWGRPGREYIRLLNQLSECEFESGFIDPCAHGATLLSRLQRDILLRAPEDAGHENPYPRDSSIKIMACPGIRREIEIVADTIWQLVAGQSDLDNDSEPLRFHDIAVMVTDRDRDRYLRHIQSVFSQSHALPFNLIDGSLRHQSRIIDAIESLLNLGARTLELEAVCQLLTHPNVGAAITEDPLRWRAWAKSLNVVFGADKAAFEETYIDAPIYHWDQALKRLALGSLMTGSVSGDHRIFETGTPGDAALPLETPIDQQAEVAHFIAFMRGLIGDVQSMSTGRMAAEQWAHYLKAFVEHYVKPLNPVDERAIGQCLGILEQFKDMDLEGQSISFSVIKRFYLGQLDGLEGRMGQHQADGITVSSLLPMRAIPFKVVFILGLGEHQFPSRPGLNPLDLRQATRIAGDVNAAERDRYLFLETLLATRRRLYLSYVAMDAGTGEVLEPSVVVRELQYILKRHLDREHFEKIVVKHPISGWDPAYFETEANAEGLPIPTRDAPRRAYALEQIGHPPHDVESEDVHTALNRQAEIEPLMKRLLGQAPLPLQPSDKQISLSLWSIRRFLESPLQGGARYGLGLVEGSQNEKGSEEFGEPLDLDGRLRKELLDTAFWAGGGDLELTESAYEEAFNRMTLSGAAPVGPFADIRKTQDLGALKAWTEQLAPLNLQPLKDWMRIRIGRGTEHSQADVVLPPIALGGDMIDNVEQVELHGHCLPMDPDRKTCLILVSGKKVEDIHFLPGFINAVALSALEQFHHPYIRVIAVPTNLKQRSRIERYYRVPPPEEALIWLRNIIQDLLNTGHGYRLPIEAVLKWKSERERAPDAGFVLLPSERTRDDYGPVQDPRSFPIPDDDTASEMIKRRFEYWFYAGT